MSDFICRIEAEPLGATFRATANHRGNGSVEVVSSDRSRTHAALALAKVIANKRDLHLVSFNDLGDGAYQARFSESPETEGA